MRFQTSFLATLSLVTLSLTPLAAHATGVAEVSTNGKGAVGGALIGAEVVLAAEAAFDTKPTWAYVVGGVAGGIGGGIGGYFIERNANPKVPMLMLGAGMALAIPTTVAVLSATAYEPPASYTQDHAPADEPVAEPPQPGSQPLNPPPPNMNAPAGTDAAPQTAPPAAGTTSPTPPPAPTPTPSTSAMPRHRAHRVARRALPPLDYHLTPPALIGISAQALTLSVPAIELRDVYSKTELAIFGVNQGTEVRVPVLNFLF